MNTQDKIKFLESEIARLSKEISVEVVYGQYSHETDKIYIQTPTTHIMINFPDGYTGDLDDIMFSKGDGWYNPTI